MCHEIKIDGVVYEDPQGFCSCWMFPGKTIAEPDSLDNLGRAVAEALKAKMGTAETGSVTVTIRRES